MASNPALPTQFGVLLYPGFEALDTFGPLEVFNVLSYKHDMKLAVIAETMEPVSTMVKGITTVGESIVPTHTFETAPQLDVLLIPGGYGGFEPSAALTEFLRTKGSKAGHLITVCNGASVAAQAGLLDGKRATTNKALWKRCVAYGPKTDWVAKARWVQDGNVWTSSGVSAGIDVALSWVESIWGKELATEFANGMEFVRAASLSDDPFAAIYDCQDVSAQS